MDTDTFTLDDLFNQAPPDEGKKIYEFLLMRTEAEHPQMLGELKGVSYESYKENATAEQKFQLGVLSLGLANKDVRLQLQQNLWTSPYGYYYVMSNIAHLYSQLLNPSVRDVLNQAVITPAIEEFGEREGEPDYQRYNYIGRLLNIVYYCVYATGAGCDDTNAQMREMYDTLVKYKNDVLVVRSKEENHPMLVESYEYCIEVFDLFEDAIEMGFQMLEDDSVNIELPEKMQKVWDYVDQAQKESLTPDKDIVTNDILRDINNLKKCTSDKFDELLF